MNPAHVEANVDPAAWLLTGQVMHERLRPKHHHFVYPVFCVRCDLDRLASLDSRWFGVDRWRPLSLYQRDHGPRDGSDLATWMRAQLSAAGIEAADGKIWLQAFPRVFGYAFNGAQLRAKRTVTGFETHRRRRSFAHLSRGRRGAAKGLLTAALVLITSAAYAHSWYPHDCCHDARV